MCSTGKHPGRSRAPQVRQHDVELREAALVAVEHLAERRAVLPLHVGPQPPQVAAVQDDGEVVHAPTTGGQWRRPTQRCFFKTGGGGGPNQQGGTPSPPWGSEAHLLAIWPSPFQPPPWEMATPPLLGLLLGGGATWEWGKHHPGRQLQLSCPLPEEGQPRKSCHTFRRAAFQLPGVGLSRTGGVAICTGLLGLGPNPATWERAFPEVQVTCTNCINLGNGLHSPTFPGASRVHF